MARYCPKCYVGIDPSDVVCKECGAILKPDIHSDSDNENSHENVLTSNEATIIDHASGFRDDSEDSDKPEYNAYHKDKLDGTESNVIGLGEWVLVILLTMIPIVNIIMPIIWAVSENTNPNKQNFARAYLIWIAVGICLSMLMVFGFFALIAAFAGPWGFF